MHLVTQLKVLEIRASRLDLLARTSLFDFAGNSVEAMPINEKPSSSACSSPVSRLSFNWHLISKNQICKSIVT